MKQSMKQWLSVFCGISVFLSSNAFSGDRANVRGMGMARTAVASALALDAVGVNPANLARPEGGTMSLTVLPIGAYLESDFFSYDLYSRYLKTRIPLVNLSESDKQALLRSFAGPVGRSTAEVTARLFGIALRINPKSSVAFTVDYSLVGAGNLPRDYARLLLYGTTPGEQFDVQGLLVKGFWTRSYAVSYGQLLPPPSFFTWLAAGVSVKMMQGYGYYEIESGDASLRTSSDGRLAGNVAWRARWTTTNSLSRPLDNLFQDPTGYGVGFDLGIAGGIDDVLSFGVSLMNLGSISWTRDVAERSSDSAVSTTEPDVFKNVFSALKTPDGAQRGSPFASTLPGLFRVGVAAQIDRIRGSGMFEGQLLFALEYMRGVGPRSPLTEDPRFSFGIEYKPVTWLPVRTGVALGGYGGSHIAFGFGINFRTFDLDFATEDILLLFEGTKYSTGSVGVGVRVRVP